MLSIHRLTTGDGFKYLLKAVASGDIDIVQLTQAQNDAADAKVETLRQQQQEAELRIALEVATGRLLGDHHP